MDHLFGYAILQIPSPRLSLLSSPTSKAAKQMAHSAVDSIILRESAWKSVSSKRSTEGMSCIKLLEFDLRQFSKNRSKICLDPMQPRWFSFQNMNSECTWKAQGCAQENLNMMILHLLGSPFRLRCRLCLRIRLACAPGALPCPRSPPLKPQSPPVPNLKGCLFIVEHLHV